MGATCGTYRGEERCTQGFGEENIGSERERALGTPCVAGRY